MRAAIAKAKPGFYRGAKDGEEALLSGTRDAAGRGAAVVRRGWGQRPVGHGRGVFCLVARKPESIGNARIPACAGMTVGVWE